MRCAVVQELFSDIYDGIAEKQAVLLKHLQSCPTCATEYEAYSNMLDELRQLPEPELPAGFHETMMNKIQEIAPPSDHTIDVLLDEIETRSRLRESKSKRQRNSKRAATLRRWAGVAVAAGLLFASMWAVTVLDLPIGRWGEDAMMIPPTAAQSYDAPSEPVPQAEEAPRESAEAELEPAPEPAEPEADMAAPEADSEPEFALAYDEIDWYAYSTEEDGPEDIPNIGDRSWAAQEEEEELPYSPIAAFDSLAEGFDADDLYLWDDVAGYGISPYDQPETCLGGQDLPSAAPHAGAGHMDGVYSYYPPTSVAAPLVHGGEGARAWAIAILAGLAPLCLALGAVLWSISKKTHK